MEGQKNSGQNIRLPLYIAAAISFGIFIGARMTGTAVERTDFVKSLQKFRQVITFIENDYVDEVDTEALVEGVISSMLEKLDPHTSYIPAVEQALLQSQLEGNFEGIGIEFNIFRDTIHVVTPLSGGPSEKLGLQAGDKIIKVEDETVAGIGLTNRDVVQRLRGPKGSKVRISILRKGTDNSLIEYTIVRDVIPQFSVDVSYMIDDKTGYIKVSRFAATTYREFREALEKLQAKGMSQLVLDLTGNPGGYLEQAVDMADEFLADNQLVVYTQGKEARYNENRLSRRKGIFEEGPLVVLIDEGTASAPEIVTGALQDHDRALIVGRRSYGKGLVQMPIRLNDGSELRLTISRYYIPSGRCIQKPYNGNLDDYHMEYASRFENGEVFDEEQMKVNDTAVYRTDKGRIVYGGGGIVPDHFVAFDTTGNSRYLNQLFTSNTMAEYALIYTEEHRAELEKQGLDKYVKNFTVSEAMLAEIIKNAKENKVPFDKTQYEASKEHLKMYVKAFIGRRMWDNEGFYPVINQKNEILLKAVTLFDEAEELAKK